MHALTQMKHTRKTVNMPLPCPHICTHRESAHTVNGQTQRSEPTACLPYPHSYREKISVPFFCFSSPLPRSPFLPSFLHSSLPYEQKKTVPGATSMSITRQH